MAGESTTSGLNNKIDNVLDKLSTTIDTLIEEFAANPFRTTLKVVAIIYFIKWVRRTLR